MEIIPSVERFSVVTLTEDSMMDRKPAMAHATQVTVALSLTLDMATNALVTTTTKAMVLRNVLT